MELLNFCGIKDSSSFKQWASKNHPDKGGDTDKFVLVREAYEKYIQSPSPSSQPSRSSSQQPRKQTYSSPHPQDNSYNSFFGYNSSTTCPDFDYRAADDLMNDLCKKFMNNKLNRIKPNQCKKMIKNRDRNTKSRFYEGEFVRCQKTQTKDSDYCHLHKPPPPPTQ